MIKHFLLIAEKDSDSLSGCEFWATANMFGQVQAKTSEVILPDFRKKNRVGNGHRSDF